MTTNPTPAQAEATDVDTITLSWRTFELELPPTPDDWPITATEAIENGKAATFVRELIGPKQWAKLTGARPAIRNADLAELADAIMKAEGVGDTGE